MDRSGGMSRCGRPLTRGVRNRSYTACRSTRLVPGRGTCAQVAELVDALASGASFRKEVEVRVFSWAPKRFFKCVANCALRSPVSPTIEGETETV